MASQPGPLQPTSVGKQSTEARRETGQTLASASCLSGGFRRLTAPSPSGNHDAPHSPPLPVRKWPQRRPPTVLHAPGPEQTVRQRRTRNNSASACRLAGRPRSAPPARSRQRRHHAPKQKMCYKRYIMSHKRYTSSHVHFRTTGRRGPRSSRNYGLSAASHAPAARVRSAYTQAHVPPRTERPVCCCSRWPAISALMPHTHTPTQHIAPPLLLLFGAVPKNTASGLLQVH